MPAKPFSSIVGQTAPREAIRKDIRSEGLVASTYLHKSVYVCLKSTGWTIDLVHSNGCAHSEYAAMYWSMALRSSRGEVKLAARSACRQSKLNHISTWLSHEAC